MNYHFEVQWRESKADKWEPQQGGFNSRRDANDWIVDQPDGGMYRVVIEERETPTVETIDLTPVGCQTPEGNEQVNRAMRVCDMTTVTVAELATQMVETLEANQYSESYASAKFDALKAAIKARKDAYENLLKSVSGR